MGINFYSDIEGNNNDLTNWATGPGGGGGGGSSTPWTIDEIEHRLIFGLIDGNTTDISTSAITAQTVTNVPTTSLDGTINKTVFNFAASTHLAYNHPDVDECAYVVMVLKLNGADSVRRVMNSYIANNYIDIRFDMASENLECTSEPMVAKSIGDITDPRILYDYSGVTDTDWVIWVAPYKRGMSKAQANGSITSIDSTTTASTDTLVPQFLNFNGFLTAIANPEGTTSGTDWDLWAMLLLQDISESEIDKLVGYLAHEAGLTASLPTGHPYKTDAPTVGGGGGSGGGGFAEDIGNGADTTITVTHNLGTKDVVVQVWDNTTPFSQVFPTVNHDTDNTVDLIFAVAPTSNQYRVFVTSGGGGSSGGRELLTANRTYYVSTTGSDSNDGLTVGSPFLTIQKAVDETANIDLGIFNVDIQLADGTYSITSQIELKTLVGSGQVFIKGNAGTPANVVLTGSDSNVIIGCYAGDYKLQDFTIDNGSGNCIYIFGCKASTVRIANLRFGTSTGVHFAVERGPVAFIEGDMEIFGDAIFHWYALGQSLINGTFGTHTITLTSTPNFSASFVTCQRQGLVTTTTSSITFSGSATGTRYSVDTLSLIDTNGGGATFYPGNAAGTTANGGLYL